MSHLIQMPVPIVEMDGDEMAHVLWQRVKEKLVFPYVDLNVEYFDLSLGNRDRTEGRVTVAAAHAVTQHGVALKCSTIVPTDEIAKIQNLKKVWENPNVVIRGILGGTVLRSPILAKHVNPIVRTWKRPITVARHAYGDTFRNVEMQIPGPGKLELVFKGEDGNVHRSLVHEFTSPGVARAVHNIGDSIRSFARACCEYALETHRDLWFATKESVSKTYDVYFREIFHDVYETEFAKEFAKEGIDYLYTFINDALERMMRSEGNLILALKNYDGDLISSIVGAGFGSLGLINSALRTPEKNWLYETVHGTITWHYYKHMQARETSSNAMPTICAWARTLRRRGIFDHNKPLQEFGEDLERSAIMTIENGIMTRDVALISDHPEKRVVDTFAFIDAVSKTYTESCRRNA